MTWLLRSLPINLEDLEWAGPMHQNVEFDEAAAERTQKIRAALEQWRRDVEAVRRGRGGFGPSPRKQRY